MPQTLGAVNMYLKIENYLRELESSFSSISSERRKLLSEVAEYIRGKQENNELVQLNFICTHNSRRSHLAQLWTQVSAHHFGLENILTFSGGTEATAFNPRAVAAIERAGFVVDNPGGENPKYEIRFAENVPPLYCFSKTFDDPANPTSGFAAIMTCSHADENCPFVPGAEYRAAVTYTDPKEADGTDAEAKTYDERCRQIATEMLYMIQQVQNNRIK